MGADLESSPEDVLCNELDADRGEWFRVQEASHRIGCRGTPGSARPQTCKRGQRHQDWAAHLQTGHRHGEGGEDTSSGHLPLFSLEQCPKFPQHANNTPVSPPSPALPQLAGLLPRVRRGPCPRGLEALQGPAAEEAVPERLWLA